MPESVRYWLLIGEVPSGPFTVAEVRAKLAAREATWETPACAVGGTWGPLLRTPGCGPADVAPRTHPGSNASPPPTVGPRPHAPERRPDAPPPAGPPTNPGGATARRVVGALGGLLVLLFLGAVIWRATGTGRDPGGAPARQVPAEYRPYLRDGKIVPTGHPTLDYWVRINVFLETLQGPQNELALPSLLRTLAKGIRERPAAGIDPDLTRWGTAVAALLDARADLVEQLSDPATLTRARAEVASGRPNPLDGVERSVTVWERERDRLVAEGASLREALSRRHARTFPSPQL